MANPINSSPLFTALGNVFGRLASQWNQYFSSKVDAENGQADSLALTGSITINGSPLETFIGADLPLAQAGGSGVLVLEYDGNFALNGSGELTLVSSVSQNQTNDFLISSLIGTYFLDSTSGVITATLPADPELDEEHTLVDRTGAAGTNAVNLAGNGNNIIGQATIAGAIQTAYGFITVRWNGTSWSQVG
jgi:hypothetical protein